jgi:hypothetical protein
MRALACVALAGCFAPNVIAGQPCAPDGWCPEPLECQTDLVCRERPSNTMPSFGYAFVTSTSVALSSLPDPEAADAFCQTAADNAALPGQYIAWVSSASRNAAELLRSTTSGWLRTDGRLFADSFNSLTTGRLGYPLRIDERKMTVPAGTLVVTVTGPEGKLAMGSADCFVPSALTMVATGVVDGTTVQWTDRGFDVPCDQPTPLYCFSLDTPAPAPVIQPIAPRAFLSSQLPTGVTGRAFSDMLCRSDAMIANYPDADKFIAFVPTTTASMLAQLSTGPWTRPDGVTFLDTDSTILAPLNVTSKLEYFDVQVWGGTTQIDRPAQSSENCNDWMGSVPSGLLGRASRSSPVEMVDDNGFTDSCFVSHNVYCISP